MVPRAAGGRSRPARLPPSRRNRSASLAPRRATRNGIDYFTADDPPAIIDQHIDRRHLMPKRPNVTDDVTPKDVAPTTKAGPRELPLVALRETVIFPEMIVPLQ